MIKLLLTLLLGVVLTMSYSLYSYNKTKDAIYTAISIQMENQCTLYGGNFNYQTMSCNY